MFRWLSVFGCALSFAVSTMAQADTHRFTFSGFASLGFSYESRDDLGFFRDNTQRKRPDNDGSFAPDSQLGVQVSYQFNPEWQATAQFVAADKAEYDLDSATELAFVGYSPLPDLDVRAGRMAVDMFQLSEVRRVDYTHLWVRPPVELYGWITPYSIDGIDISKSFSLGSVYLRAKIQYGNTRPTIQQPDASRLLETEFEGLAVASLTAEYGFWSLRTSYAQFDLSEISQSQDQLISVIEQVGSFPGPVGNEAQNFASKIRDGYGSKVQYYQAGLAFDNGTHILNLEVAGMRSDAYVLPTGNAGYISYGRRLGSWTPYAAYSAFEPDKSLIRSKADWSTLPFPGGEGLQAFSVGFLNGPRIDQDTVSLGLRWDFARRAALKAQWDRSAVKGDAYGLWAFEEKPKSDRTVNVFSLSLNTIF